MGLNNLAHGSLGHAIEHGQVKDSHMAFNVQHKFNLIYTKGEIMWYGRATWALVQVSLEPTTLSQLM